MSAEPWVPGSEAPPLPWPRVEASLRQANRLPDPHRLTRLHPHSDRRAAVAVLLWGDPEGARKVVLVQRGQSAPQHPGELAFPGGMAEPRDRDLPSTARRELMEELGITEDLWELGCFPDGIAKGRTRFTPVFFRWETPNPTPVPGPEIQRALMLPLQGLLDAPWTTQRLALEGTYFSAPRLEMEPVALWGATARVLKAWLDLLAGPKQDREKHL
nr:CoA pyrophosphatase [uncultured Holophaga sp.]